jgi:hypothetical protein
MENLEKRVSQLGEKASTDFKSVLQRVKPTYDKLEQAYKDDMTKLYKEISNDQVLKEISESL